MTTTIKDFLLRKNAEYGRKAQAAAAAYEYEASARYYQKARACDELLHELRDMGAENAPMTTEQGK